jgi:cell division protein FtsB
MEVLKTLKNSKIIVFILIFIILSSFITYKFYVNHIKIIKLQKRIEELNVKIEISRLKNLELKKNLENANDPKNIEELARKELGLVKPGEVLLIPLKDEEKN